MPTAHLSFHLAHRFKPVRRSHCVVVGNSSSACAARIPSCYLSHSSCFSNLGCVRQHGELVYQTTAPKQMRVRLPSLHADAIPLLRHANIRGPCRQTLCNHPACLFVVCLLFVCVCLCLFAVSSDLLVSVDESLLLVFEQV